MPAQPSLPRFQEGPRSQQLLTVLLGDYWFARSDPIPSTALVELMRVFDVSASGARAAIQRLAQRGVLQGVKAGRQTAYGVPPMTREKINGHVVGLFRSHLPQEWDGGWTLVAYSVPEGAKELRRQLRDRLRQMRFGSLYDGLWIRPGSADAAAALADLGDEARLTVFADARTEADDPSVRAAFALDELADEYRAFAERWEPLAAELAHADAAAVMAARAHRPGDEALRQRTSIMKEWRVLRHGDPLLPREVLGAEFPLDRAVAAVTGVYDPLGPLAEEAFRRILEPQHPDLARLVTHHTFAASGSILDG